MYPGRMEASVARSDNNTSPSLFQAAVDSIRRRHRVFVAAGVLAVLAVVGSQAWRYASVEMRDDPRYQVTAQSIETTPPPPWIRTDIRLEALRDAGLRGDLSVLDSPERLQKRIADAFTFHPWVESVGTITKQPPNRITVELTYRQPMAAVEFHNPAVPAGNLAAVDKHGIRLPGQGLTDVELRHLPRVRSIASTSLPGEVWRDGRVLGAVSLISAIGPRWDSLELLEVIPSRSTEAHGDLRYYVYELVTTGGTRIVWGAAPNATPPGESSFSEKLARLERFVAQNGPLRSTFQTPEEINLRNGLQIVARTAKLPSEKPTDDETLLKK